MAALLHLCIIVSIMTFAGSVYPKCAVKVGASITCSSKQLGHDAHERITVFLCHGLIRWNSSLVFIFPSTFSVILKVQKYVNEIFDTFGSFVPD